MTTTESARRSRNDRIDEVGSTVGPFEPVIESRQLPPVFDAEFRVPSDGSHDILLEGHMKRIWRARRSRFCGSSRIGM
jgi:hypothetical protein